MVEQFEVKLVIQDMLQRGSPLAVVESSLNRVLEILVSALVRLNLGT